MITEGDEKSRRREKGTTVGKSKGRTGRDRDGVTGEKEKGKMKKASRHGDGEGIVENRSRALGKERSSRMSSKGRKRRRVIGVTSNSCFLGGGKKESTLGGEGELGGTSWY